MTQEMAFELPADRLPAEVCRTMDLEPQAVALLDEDMTPARFLAAMIEARLYPDATRFLACLLPPRQAVAWACLCARAVTGDDAGAESRAALEAAETWVRAPSQENAEAAKATADLTDLDTAGALAALAAYFSGESLAPGDLPTVPPPPDLSGRGAAAAVMLGVTSVPALAEQRYRAFLAKGIEIARTAVGAGAAT